LINSGPFLTEEAYTAKLVDRIDFRHNLIPVVHEKLGKNVPLISIGAYLETLPPQPKGNKVALIFGSGMIQRNGKDSTVSELVITANATYKAFQLAIDDPEVKAIVYRINSEGGSPIAS